MHAGSALGAPEIFWNVVQTRCVWYFHEGFPRESAKGRVFLRREYVTQRSRDMRIDGIGQLRLNEVAAATTRTPESFCHHDHATSMPPMGATERQISRYGCRHASLGR